MTTFEKKLQAQSDITLHMVDLYQIIVVPLFAVLQISGAIGRAEPQIQPGS
jgi:hypothetical protein